MNLEEEINQRIEYLKLIDEDNPDYFQLHNMLKARINSLNESRREKYYDKIKIFKRSKHYG